MSQTWYLEMDGNAVGPLSTSELVARAARGEVQPTTKLHRSLQEPWTTASKVIGLKFAGGSSESPRSSLDSDQPQAPAEGATNLPPEPSSSEWLKGQAQHDGALYKPFFSSDDMASSSINRSVDGAVKGLGDVAIGLNLVYLGILIVLLSAISIFLSSVFMGEADANGGGGVAIILFRFGPIALLAGLVVGMIGRVFCLAVPEQSRARDMILAAVICEGAGVLISIASILVSMPAIELSGRVASLLAGFFFVVFLKRTSDYLGRVDLASHAQRLIAGLIGITLVLVAAFAIMFTIPTLARLVTWMFMALSIFVIFMFFSYVSLLTGLRTAILNRAESKKSKSNSVSSNRVWIGIVAALLLGLGLYGGAIAYRAYCAATEAADRQWSVNKLAQISLAIGNYENANGYSPFFAPADSKQDKMKSLLSWRVRILPYLEQQALYAQFHHDEPWDSEHNRSLIAKMPEIFRAPGSKVSKEFKTTYLALRGDAAASAELDFSDMIVEASDDRGVIWTKPDVAADIDLKNPEKGLRLRGGGFLVCDFYGLHFVDVKAQK